MFSSFLFPLGQRICVWIFCSFVVVMKKCISKTIKKNDELVPMWNMVLDIVDLRKEKNLIDYNYY